LLFALKEMKDVSYSGYQNTHNRKEGRKRKKKKRGAEDEGDRRYCKTKTKASIMVFLI
jgi:hypothetical protein